MSRPTHVNNIKTFIVAGVVALLAIGGGTWAVTAHLSDTHKPKVQAAHTVKPQFNGIGYKGVDGQNALDLLKKHATVETKHYSFGDMVMSINGVAGTGPKYWTFYVNGQQAKVGAGSYVTKDSDKIMWRLQ